MKRQLGLVMAVGIEMLIANLQVLADQVGNTLQAGGLCDFNVTAHGVYPLDKVDAEFTSAAPQIPQ